MAMSNLSRLRTYGLCGLWLLCTALDGCEQRHRYPTMAEDFLRAPIPADGRIHVHQSGKFAIAPSTHICRLENSPGLDPGEIERALTARNQSLKFDNEWRTNGVFGDRPSPGCEGGASSDAIFVNYEVEPRLPNGPYKMTVVAWQREAVWVGMIKRSDGLRADAVAGPISPNDGPSWTTREDLKTQSLIEVSRRLDWRDLSRKFLSELGR